MNNLHISLTSFKNESRLLKEAKSLIDYGFVSAVFVAALHEGDLKESEVIGPNCTATRFKLSSRHWGTNIVVRLVKYLEFCIRVYLYYRKQRIKCVNVHSLALLPLGCLLKLSFGAKLIYDAHELETESNGLSGFRQRMAKLIERQLIKYVDGVIVVSESIADWYHNEYQKERPVVVMNSPIFQDVNKSNIFRDELGIPEDKIIFLYQGALSLGRGINLILESFKNTESKNIVVVFMGYGTLEDEILKMSKSFDNIYFYPAVSPEVVLSYTASADVGFSLAENRCLSYDYSMPNKMFEYTMVGIPIIASKMVDIEKFINKYELGLIIEAETEYELSKAIDKISESGTDCFKMHCAEASKAYSWEVQEMKMLKAYKQWGFRGNL